MVYENNYFILIIVGIHPCGVRILCNHIIFTILNFDLLLLLLFLS